ncbi:MAG: hypothetical protein GY757_61310 [bacterium]|nr:hypothetical protein [bacterium]
MSYNADKLVSLGFTEQQFPAGIHICHIYRDINECEDAFLKFIISGLKAGEKTSFFSRNSTAQLLEEEFEKLGIIYEDKVESGAFSLSDTKEVYFRDDCFLPERMLALLADYYTTSQEEGYPAARVIGEMLPEIKEISGGSRLLEYEAKVSLLLKTHPVTAVCQYDAEAFDGATIMDILKVHPLMLIRGGVIHNPFFIPPEDFLGSL